MSIKLKVINKVIGQFLFIVKYLHILQKTIMVNKNIFTKQALSKFYITVKKNTKPNAVK